MAGPSLSAVSSEDHLADSTTIFDPDNSISCALLARLASATSTDARHLCHPFVRPGTIHSSPTEPAISFQKGLLDTGAQGSNFISRNLFEKLPASTRSQARPINRIVRLGDARQIAVQLDVPLTVSITDSTGLLHTHTLWYSVLDDLSHDIIIGLIDLIGPYYSLFETSVTLSRRISLNNDAGCTLSDLTDTVLSLLEDDKSSDTFIQTSRQIIADSNSYQSRKSSICANTQTTAHLLALQDGTTANTLIHPVFGQVFVDKRIEDRYDQLANLLTTLLPGTTLLPWSKPIDSIAPEELETPDPTSFPDDILTYMTISAEEARNIYLTDLDTHVTSEIREACPHITSLLTSQLALDVFVPSDWKEIDMPPYHLPDHLRSRSRPVREALYEDARIEFQRMRQYFYENSTSPIASPLVIAPKATAPFIRLCGDYRLVNPYVNIPQEPIPHVQQSLAKAAGWKYSST